MLDCLTLLLRLILLQNALFCKPEPYSFGITANLISFDRNILSRGITVLLISSIPEPATKSIILSAFGLSNESVKFRVPVASPNLSTPVSVR